MSTPLDLAVPDGVRRVDLTTARGRFAAQAAGPDGDSAVDHAPSLLLVPGWTGSKEDFSPLQAELARRGSASVSYDQRGQFETAGLADPVAYTLDALADDVVAVATRSGTLVRLVGHSFGGLVATRAATRRPELFTDVTLLCSGPAGLGSKGFADPTRLLIHALHTLPIGRVYDIKLSYDRRRPAYATPPADIARFLRNRFVANSPVALAAITQSLVDTPDGIDALVASGVPGRVVFGVEDDVWPLDVQRETAHRLGGDAVEIPGAGHSPAVSHPGELADALTL